MTDERDLWALVLAGGDGTRLRELTRAIAGVPIPKQYCRIAGERSLLEATLARVTGHVPPERTLVIVNADHLPLATDQLRGVPPANVLVQPANRDTGPGLLLSLLHLARRQPEARLAVFPSDHYVGNQAAFLAHVARATRLVGRLPAKVALLGICPEHPEPQYGYIEPARPLGLPDGGPAFHVAAFREKPTAAEAERIAGRGGLWNSFVMAFQLGRMLDLLRRARPADVLRLRAYLDDPRGPRPRLRHPPSMELLP